MKNLRRHLPAAAFEAGMLGKITVTPEAIALEAIHSLPPSKEYLMKTTRAFFLALSLAALAAPLASAANQQAVASAVKSAEGSEGEVKKIDKSAGKLTIKHGELKNLDMPPMTMVFRVKDTSMLDKVKAGDRIRFVAEQVDGKLVVVQLDPAQ